ncbi:MAG: DUF3084 domain-containing protein [Armatimonadetes bacterium]|nr:DUF3084 domain-containing protein [Armatimonadota bacterium]
MLGGIISILILVVMGGVIAYVGDNVGRRFGRKKLTIFRLRPRYTSMIFTIAFGMLISLATVIILSLVSLEARTALFGMRKLKEERASLERQVEALSRRTNLGLLVFPLNHPILMEEVQGGQSPEAIQKTLSRLLARANELAIRKNNEIARLRREPTIREDQKLVWYRQEDYDSAVQELAKRKGNCIVIAASYQNAFLGDPVILRFNFAESKLIFKEKEVITSSMIDGRQGRKEVLVRLFRLLGKLQSVALERGMLPDPLTSNFGGDVQVASLLDRSDEIVRAGRPQKVLIIAKQPIWTAGPLRVDIEVLNP